MNKQRILSLALVGLTIIVAALVWRLSVLSQSLAEDTPVATSPQIDQSTDSLKRISDSLVIAKRDNKRVLLQFGSRGCTWCRLLHNLFKKDTRIMEELESDYIVVMVDVSDGNNKGVDDKYGHPIRDGLPVTVILDSDGNQLMTQNIAFADEDALRLKDCRIDSDKVLLFLRKWSPKNDSHADNMELSFPAAASNR